MKNIILKLPNVDQANKALIKFGEAANKTPDIKMPPTKLQKFSRDVCTYFSILMVKDEVIGELSYIQDKIKYGL